MEKHWQNILTIGVITFEQKMLLTVEKTTIVSREGADEMRVQVGDNWGNAIYMNKQQANIVYRKILSEEIPRYNIPITPFRTVDIISKIRQVIQENSL